MSRSELELKRAIKPNSPTRITPPVDEDGPIPMTGRSFGRRVLAAVEAFRAGAKVFLADKPTGYSVATLPVASVTTGRLLDLASVAVGSIYLNCEVARLQELGLVSDISAGAHIDPLAPARGVGFRRSGTRGDSMQGRAAAIRRVIVSAAVKRDFDVPGNTVPIGTSALGVLNNPTISEGAVDLARAANLFPAAVTAMVRSRSGDFAGFGESASIAKRLGIPYLTVSDIVKYRLATEPLVTHVVHANIPLINPDWVIRCYSQQLSKRLHVAHTLGSAGPGHVVPVLVLSHCLLGLVFSSSNCGCREVMDDAIVSIEQSGTGVVIILDCADLRLGDIELPHSAMAYEGRAYRLPSLDVFDTYIAAQIIDEMRINPIRLLATNPSQALACRALGIRVIG